VGIVSTLFLANRCDFDDSHSPRWPFPNRVVAFGWILRYRHSLARRRGVEDSLAFIGFLHLEVMIFPIDDVFLMRISVAVGIVCLYGDRLRSRTNASSPPYDRTPSYIFCFCFERDTSSFVPGRPWPFSPAEGFQKGNISPLFPEALQDPSLAG